MSQVQPRSFFFFFGAVGPDAQYLSILFSLLSFHWLGGGGYCCLVGRCSILQCDNFPELDVLAKHAFLCPFLWVQSLSL